MKQYSFAFALILLFLTARGAEIVKTLDAPVDGITGLAFFGTSLYANSETETKFFKINPENGTVIKPIEFFFTDNNMVCTGAGAGGNLLYVLTGGTLAAGNGLMFIYNQSDQFQDYCSAFCWTAIFQSVTGAGGNASNLYLCGKEVSTGKVMIARCFPLPFNNVNGKQEVHAYLSGITATRDIACEGFDDTRADGNMWVACNDADKPIKSFDKSGKIVEEVPASIGIGSDIWGLAWEKGSGRILWANNKSQKKIYKIDLDATGIQTDLNNTGAVSDNFNINISGECVKLCIPYDGNSRVTVSDIKGRESYSFTAKNNTWYILSKQAFVPGMNIIRVSNAGKTVVRKIITVN